MNRKQQKQKGLQHIIRYSVLTIIILQVVVTVFIIGISGTKKQLDSNAEKILENTITFRTDNLEENLLRWSDFSEEIHSMEMIMSDLENSYHTTGMQLIKDKAVRNSILQQSADLLLPMLRKTKGTGAFVILDGGISTDKKSALYLRDLNPENTPENNVDILVEAGGGESILAKGYTLDTEWSMELPIGTDSDFFHRPMQAVVSKPGMKNKDYGYFSTGFRLYKNDIEIMTYTVPLLDQEGKPYGVMGVELHVDYLKKLLPSKEIGVDSDAGFLFGILEEDGNVRDVIVEGNHFQTRINEDNVLLQERSDSFYEVTFANQEGKIIANVLPLHIYDRNTPFESDQWILAGLVHSDALYQSSHKLLIAFGVTIVIAVIISIIGAILVTSTLLKPIKLLMTSLNLKAGTAVELPKTQIIEIDELAREIERLNEASFKEGGRVSNILDISNLPLGVFEYEEGEETLFCTKQVFLILGMSMECWSNNYIARIELEREYAKIKDTILEEDKADCVYRIQKEGGASYFRFRSSQKEKRNIYILMDVTEEVQEKQAISHDRDYDVLTNLYNRRAFSREINVLLETENCSKAVLSVWDLDNLKYINDTYGHDMGDQYIRLLADVFKQYRQDGLLVGRISGDEFMIFSYANSREENIERIRTIHSAFLARKLVLPDGIELAVSASAGTSQYATDAITYEELVKYADFAMYEAKKSEKGSLCHFSRSNYIKNYILICGVGELNRIIKEEDVKYAFQPIFDIKSKSIFAYEALMRPNSNVLMRPDELLRVATVQSKLKQIEVLTWRHAMQAFSEKFNGQDIKVFINSLPDQCLGEEEISFLEENYGALMQHVVIEVTEETQSNTQYEEIKRECCRRWNAQIALDDYGSGYSNAEFLTSKTWEYVKLDRSLIQNIQESNSRKKLLEGIIAYCHENQVGIIAEGVETKEEFLEVKRLGCDYVQGYYLAMPTFELIEMTEALENKFL